MTAMTMQATLEASSTDDDVADWVRRLQDGDPTALEPLMTKYDALVRHVAWLVVHNAADAADIAQETWLRLLSARTPLHSPEHVFAWLRTTAQRLAIQVSRRRGRTTALDDSTADGLATMHEDGPDARVERDDRDARVRRALAMMPTERSGLLVDLVCSGDSYQAVGKRWCRPVGSLGPTRRRYLVELRGHLAAQGLGEPEW
jgi:RNA polymerase sigma-70 factor (ECF subfamily)